MNCSRVVETDPTIALINNWSCLSQIIWSEFGEGDVASGRVIITGGHGFESLTKPSKSYPNMRDVNWSCHEKEFVAMSFRSVTSQKNNLLVLLFYFIILYAIINFYFTVFVIFSVLSEKIKKIKKSELIQESRLNW